MPCIHFGFALILKCLITSISDLAVKRFKDNVPWGAISGFMDLWNHDRTLLSKKGLDVQVETIKDIIGAATKLCAVTQQVTRNLDLTLANIQWPEFDAVVSVKEVRMLCSWLSENFGITDPHPAAASKVRKLFWLISMLIDSLKSSESYWTPLIQDYEKGTGKVHLTSGVAQMARENPGMHMGSIEAGSDVALQVLRNRVSLAEVIE